METAQGVLAQIGERRYVQSYARDIVALTWGRVTLRLHPRDLSYLADLLERWRDDPTQQPARAGELYLAQDSRGYLMCWIADACLCICPSDIASLASLLETATERLRYGPCPESCPFVHGAHDLSRLPLLTPAPRQALN